MRYVISLSSIPPRFGLIGPALASLLRQKQRAAAVELWIPAAYRRFPEWTGNLPAVPDGVTIRRCEADLGPATKVLPAAKAWRGQGVELLFCDDDHHFDPTWAQSVQVVRQDHPEAVLCGMAYSNPQLRRLPEASKRQPRAVISPPSRQQFGYQLRNLVSAMIPRSGAAMVLQQRHRRVDRAGYADILAGCGGVALRPEFLDDLAFDMPSVVWAVDDIWLSGHLERRGIPVWADPRLNQARAYVTTARTADLLHANLDGADREEANSACIDYFRATYGIWGGVATQST